MNNDTYLGIGIIFLGTLIGSSGALFLKYSSRHIKKNLFNLFREPSFFLGLFLYGVSTIFYVFALRFGDLSTLYPVVGFSYIWVSFLSVKFLKEKMNNYKLLGIAMIIIGIIFIGLGS